MIYRIGSAVHQDLTCGIDNSALLELKQTANAQSYNRQNPTNEGLQENTIMSQYTKHPSVQVKKHLTRTYHTQANKNDVLFGREKYVHSHNGNIRYQTLVKLTIPAYTQANSNEQKIEIIRKIVNIIHTSNPPGRFLKKNSNKKWHIVGEKTVLFETSQAFLRQALDKIKHNVTTNDTSTQLECSSNKNNEEPTFSYSDKTGKNQNDDIIRKIGISYDNSSQSSMSTKILKQKSIEITENDVLCGRGIGQRLHTGNIKYRRLIKQYQLIYKLISKHKTKLMISQLIINTLILNGGRFLKKDMNGKWREVNMSMALENTCEALRKSSLERNVHFALHKEKKRL